MIPKPLLKSTPHKINTNRMFLGGGINAFHPPFEVKDDQATYIRNFSSRDYPALSVRNGRAKYATKTTTPNALGQRNNQYIHVVDGTVWKYWNGSAYVNVATGLTNAEGSFEEFATGTTKYTIFSNGTERKAWDGTTVTDLTNAPTSKIFTTHKGRVYWVRDNDIVYSALNLISDYTTPNDSGTIDVTRAKGALTSIYEYNSKVICWTEFGMHELYGTDVDNYELIDIEGDIGCISDKSVIACNKRLYWVSYDGVYEYDGSTPLKISDPSSGNGVKGGVTDYIKNINFTYKTKIISGAIGDNLYIAIPYGASSTANNLILVFDTKLRTWNIETGSFVGFETIGNTLYGVDSTGQIWNMDSGTADDTTAISSEYITKVFVGDSISRKETISQLWMVVDLPTNSTLTVSYSDSVDGNDFTTLYNFTASSSEQNTVINIPVNKLYNVNWYRLKFEGTGPYTIFYLEKVMRIKPR